MGQASVLRGIIEKVYRESVFLHEWLAWLPCRARRRLVSGNACQRNVVIFELSAGGPRCVPIARTFFAGRIRG